MRVGGRGKDNKIMKKIIPRKTLFKKALPTAFIFAILGFGLFSYDNNKDFINNFQLYHLASYATMFHVIFDSNNSGNLASVLGAFTGNENVESLNTEIRRASSVPVLLYHGIVLGDDPSDVSLENFKDQMFVLKKAGWQTVSIEDFYAFMKGEKNLPEKSFLLTFDDGAKDSYYPVDPILKALDYRAVTFIITKYSVGNGSGSNYYLSNNELKRMIKSGRWDLQSHGRDDHIFSKINISSDEGHFLSNKLWLQDEQRIETSEEFKTRIYSDFVNSKNDLENTFGIKVISFAYPFGDFGQNSINFPEAKNIILDTIKSVYPMSFYQVWGGNPKTNYPQSDSEHLFIKRINVKPQWNADDLLTVLENSRDKTLPRQDDFSEDNGWVKDWGRMDFNDNSMIVGAHASTTGSAVFLDGTYSWQDYIFKADVHLVKGQVFSLMARYKDGKNYMACSFSDKLIKVEQVLSGEKKILAELKDDFVFIGKNREVGIGVYDNVVNCYLDGKIAMKGYNLDQELNHGGIGFKTWDPQVNNSELIVKGVSVEEIK